MSATTSGGVGPLLWLFVLPGPDPDPDPDFERVLPAPLVPVNNGDADAVGLADSGIGSSLYRSHSAYIEMISCTMVAMSGSDTFSSERKVIGSLLEGSFLEEFWEVLALEAWRGERRG
jgi:hypothetical protein